MIPVYGIIGSISDNYIGLILAKFKPKKEDTDNDVSITLRLPEDLHKLLKRYCKKEDISLNKMTVQMIEHCLKEVNS